MNAKRAASRQQPPRAAKQPKNAACTDGSTQSSSSQLVPARNNTGQRGNNQADRTEFRLQSILTFRLILAAIVEKMSFGTVSRLMRTQKAVKASLDTVRPYVQMISTTHGSLEVQNNRKRAFLFESTGIPPFNPPFQVVLDEAFFRFERITILTSMGTTFFTRHVKNRLRVFGRGTKELILNRKLNDEVLRGIFQLVRPEYIQCSQRSVDPENPLFPNVDTMDIAAGGPYGAPYVCGNKIIRLLRRHRELRVSFRWQIREQVFHNLITLWIAGADVSDGKEITLSCTNLTEHGSHLSNRFLARYRDLYQLGQPYRLQRNSANSSNLLEFQLDRGHDHVHMKFKRTP